ncbi:orotidine-5'-phosphate decarboxylase [Serinicoccus kebangsaanensis]|uniref:orotidine-5'-phosphate decarboxylase n=1 Tax=Serinicoccus kebangsaanensis TaxID=2602069 RepID=UPI00124CB0E0|nr:orotidine-5'-phosphate decarboxylase [Serinicoccus kebangsaanensis]
MTEQPKSSSRPVPDRFGVRLAEAIRSRGPLCLGLDPHTGLLELWGLPDTPAGVREFCSLALEGAAPTCAAVKPQSAFFERHGSAGVAVLEEVLAACRERGLLTVLDVKRGDIGSTMLGYAEAYLGDGSPLAADALTLSPYLGYESLRPALDLARQTGRGAFVLTRTSNPEGTQVQGCGRPTVAEQVMREVHRESAGQEPCGDVGMVLGATVDLVAEGLRVEDSPAPVLTPGVGAQGADEHDVARSFGGARGRVLVPISRGILGAGADAVPEAAARWAERLATAMGSD